MTKRNPARARLHEYIVDILTKQSMIRSALIEECIKKCALSAEEIRDNAPGSRKNHLRSEIGLVINDMQSRSLIDIDQRGEYYLISTKPVVIRLEKCQKEIMKALTESPMSKIELKNRLTSIFGTDKTATTKDDDILAAYIGRLTKKMMKDGVIVISDGMYALAPKATAHANDINEILTLKSEFISRVHSRGGEFFENYFMSLLKKYVERHGKKVLECYVTGGSADGGIDGFMRTEDVLGFRETVLVQTKNRVELQSETNVRGFYGAVCAKRGTRGIYATISDFHSSAIEFLDSLDDCIGIGGSEIFKMAVECHYGIKKEGARLVVDDKIIPI
ncbi:MAG: restriction endonuclease [Clostridia bacterium]|nr:restriction endonuclease [Clostridia bacterium]